MMTMQDHHVGKQESSVCHVIFYNTSMTCYIIYCGYFSVRKLMSYNEDPFAEMLDAAEQDEIYQMEKNDDGQENNEMEKKRKQPKPKKKATTSDQEANENEDDKTQAEQ